MPNHAAFVTTGSYPTRQGNTVRLLLDGEPAFRRVCQAIETAHSRVWATITFMWPEFLMPDGRGSALEVLDRAAQRGVDVRLIFWRPNDETASWRRNAFWGAPEHFDVLLNTQPQVSIRWDRAAPGHCQHQKTWVVDAGQKTSVAFLGGLNLNPNSVVAPGHAGMGQNHDAYIELVGPAVSDVEHNFVQRWNEASERFLDDGAWGKHGRDDLRFPTRLARNHGNTSVQIQRTIHAGQYQNGAAPVGATPFKIDAGERSIFAQYCSAIQEAKDSIYLENQCLEVPEIVAALSGALSRGVEIVAVMPAIPDIAAQATPEHQTFLESRAALGQHPNFTLAGIAGLGPDGKRKPVWVHSKLMLVDDTWATLGSANLHRFSMFGNAELNAAIFSPQSVRAFRVELLWEHLGLDTSHLDGAAALRLFKTIALENHAKLLRGDHAAWQGLAVALEIAIYGVLPPAGW